MPKSIPKPRRKKAPKQVLALPDLEQSKAAVFTSSVRPGCSRVNGRGRVRIEWRLRLASRSTGGAIHEYTRAA